MSDALLNMWRNFKDGFFVDERHAHLSIIRRKVKVQNTIRINNLIK